MTSLLPIDTHFAESNIGMTLHANGEVTLRSSHTELLLSKHDAHALGTILLGLDEYQKITSDQLRLDGVGRVVKTLNGVPLPSLRP